MTDWDAAAVHATFRIDADMTEAEITAELARLASVVEHEASSLAALAEARDPDGTLARQSDALEDLLGELENITVETESECPTCRGGEAPDCAECDGTGELDPPAITEQSVADVTDAVDAAFGRFA